MIKPSQNHIEFYEMSMAADYDFLLLRTYQLHINPY